MSAISKMFLVLFISLFALGSAFADDQPVAKDVTVVVEGVAACASSAQKASCRHAALADALRRAVEKGVGIIVTSDTRTQSFLLKEDAVRTSSEGYIRDYRILEEGLKDDIYRVKIEARVAPGSPEQSLAQACRRLKDGPNPTLHVAVDGPAGKALATQLAALGLKVATRKADIEVSGRIGLMPAGERYGDFVVYAYCADTQISVTDAKSGLVLPSIDVALTKPVTGDSGEQSKQNAIHAACDLWIKRNIPIIAQALLDPGKPVDLKSGTDTPAISSGAIEVIPSPNLVPSEGPRLPIEPEDLSALARKLQDGINAKSEFSSKPVDIAVSRFKGIGIADAASVEDVLEDLSTALVKTGVFQLVERSQLDKVLTELKVQNSGLIDSATARKLGKLVGARAVLVGSISDRKDCIVINARLINTETGLVSVAESIVIDKDTDPEPVILRAGPGRQ